MEAKNTNDKLNISLTKCLLVRLFVEKYRWCVLVGWQKCYSLVGGVHAHVIVLACWCDSRIKIHQIFESFLENGAVFVLKLGMKLASIQVSAFNVTFFDSQISRSGIISSPPNINFRSKYSKLISNGSKSTPKELQNLLRLLSIIFSKRTSITAGSQRIHLVRQPTEAPTPHHRIDGSLKLSSVVGFTWNCSRATFSLKVVSKLRNISQISCIE